MWNVSNILSALRLPLALAFLSENQTLRCIAIVAAMLTDCLDGYFARRFRYTSQLGAVLDPFTDKFFVIFLFVTFIVEGSLKPWQMLAMLGRDFAVLTFGIYLYLTGEWERYQFRAIWCGKVTTFFQFLVLIGLTYHYPIPSAIFPLFITLGVFSFIELYLMARPASVQS